MRALVIVHDPGSESALVGDRFEHHGFDLVDVAITTEPGNPVGSADGLGDPDDYDVIVPMGSTCSLVDRDRISSWIDDELDFLRRADVARVPVFGVCFGGQALALVHGGKVVRSERPQVGWHPLTPIGGTPLPGGPWMQWHYDRFEPPPDAEVLAVDEIGVQAFTLRRNLGVQFHPEVTRAHLERWLGFGGDIELGRLGIDPDALLAGTEARFDDVAARTNTLVDWFLADVARR